MGGKVLDLPEFVLYDKGVADGIDIGKITARYEDGLSISEIALKSNVSIEVVESVLRDAGMISD